MVYGKGIGEFLMNGIKKISYYIIILIIFIPNLCFILLGPGKLSNELFGIKDYLIPAMLNIGAIIYCIYYNMEINSIKRNEEEIKNIKIRENIINTLNFISKYDFSNTCIIENIYFKDNNIYIKLKSNQLLHDFFNFDVAITSEQDIIELDKILNKYNNDPLYADTHFLYFAINDLKKIKR